MRDLNYQLKQLCRRCREGSKMKGVNQHANISRVHRRTMLVLCIALYDQD